MSGAHDHSVLVDWIQDGVAGNKTPQLIISEFGDRMTEAGIPVDRLALFVETLHPSIIGRRFIWRPGAEVVVAEARFGPQSANIHDSPVGEVVRTGAAYRRRLADPEIRLEYAVLEDLRAEGYTDYLMQPLPFTDGSIHGINWCTRHAGGFSETDLAAFETVRLPVARLAEVYALKRVTTNLLNAYVGERTGARILAGQIRRGDVELIRAAIWLSDMRGFTALSESLPGPELVAVLNRHFDCLVSAVQQHDGEILKYMGDGLMAIFPTSETRTETEASQAALAAARAARENLAADNRERADAGLDPLGYGISLHFGDIHYGNIGGGDRLDFTAIGPAVNIAARLDSVAAATGRDIVASADFCRVAGHVGEALGSHSIKGSATPVDVFAVSE